MAPEVTTTPRRGVPPAVFSVLAVLGAWWGASASGLLPPLFLPGPVEVVRRLLDLIVNGFLDATLMGHLWASLSRVGLALGFAVISGIPLGILMGVYPRVHAAIDPLIEFIRPVPPLAYLPLIVIWCGIGELSKVLLIYLGILAPLVVASSDAVRRLEPARARAAAALGATPLQVLRWVVLPGALPEMITGIRVALGVGWSTLVAAELVAATRGLGFMVQTASQMLVTDVVVAGILVIAAVALALELALRALERRYGAWATHT